MWYLIMTHSHKKQADEFNRSVLDMSFTLLRKKQPKLALLIRNILFTVKLTKPNNSPNNANTDIFKINLDSLQVRAIVENLNEILLENQQLDHSNNTSIFRPLLIESILNEWLELAKLMLKQLNK